MLEVENYIHPSLIKQVYPIEEDFVQFQQGWLEDWKEKNVPKELSVFLKALKAAGNTQIRDEGQASIKRIFSSQAAPLMTIEHLHELEAYEEVNGWFEKLKEAIG
jgi:DNA-binding transcriptional regulator GbsR (MarR family)